MAVPVVKGDGLESVGKGEFAAYTNNEINSGKNHETFTLFSAVVGGATHRKICSICPPNIILEFFCLLVIPYTWEFVFFGRGMRLVF